MEQRRARRRTAREWALDVLAFLFAVGWAGLVVLAYELDDAPLATPGWAAVADFYGWAAGCLLLWARRSRPVPVALATVLLSAVSGTAAGAMLVALYGAAVRRPPRTALLLGLLSVACGAANTLIWRDLTLPVWGNLLFGAVLTAVISFSVIGWGLLVGARRRLIGSLRERAVRAEREAELQAEQVRLAEREARLLAEQARRAERERITREMHDALGHRLSLLSVHAGALAYRTDASREEVAQAAGVIRESAHQALQDLREVIGMLRSAEEDDGAGAERPQPTLAGVEELVAESADAGMRVRLDRRLDGADAERAPGTLARSAYRIVQEALTNARKHAPGAEVAVVLEGGREEGLTVEVASGPADGDAPRLPAGSGQGLIGLAERAALVGGRLEHGPTPDGGFRVAAWLPWPS
ncbi:sensor histidine kinase [Nocardiopsis composta]|uniref:histidine kinase n=1 Tax=Nocardiopsis composta TaxID=157465 RepID=A0A7W8QN29_9ACTN|nr:histidine kinase [Nocardiopsis composta]MBB5433309.1 signal transduction histidine kinase [Nocardiopsis composta]